MILDRIHRHDPSRQAIVDVRKGETITYGGLVSTVESAIARLRAVSGRPLVFLYASNSADAIALYLACLGADCPVCLLEPREDWGQSRLISSYSPDIVLVPSDISGPPGYQPQDSIPCVDYGFYVLEKGSSARSPLHEDLSLLLTTSGSTGDPQLVRLTQSNVFANASSIVEYLGVTEEDVSIQGLPIHYSYGLSLVNSHLVAGGSIVLPEGSFMATSFWKSFDEYSCTSFAGVPFMYETLCRLRFDPAKHPSVRTMTQAGGALRPDLAKLLHDQTTTCGCRFFVMYGQTEATARIAFVPPDRLAEKLGSIGIPIPRGRLELAAVEGADDMTEMVYTGPNVMMGYAESRDSLSLGDELHGVLHTGDIARVDDEGFFYLTGRLKRFAKLFGKRINLADIEAHLEVELPVCAAAVDIGDRIAVYVQCHTEVDHREIANRCSKYLGVTPTAFVVRPVNAMPRTPWGKKDYKQLL